VRPPGFVDVAAHAVGCDGGFVDDGGLVDECALSRVAMLVEVAGANGARAGHLPSLERPAEAARLVGQGSSHELCCRGQLFC
jgi:hypothetical protein